MAFLTASPCIPLENYEQSEVTIMNISMLTMTSMGWRLQIWYNRIQVQISLEHWVMLEIPCDVLTTRTF